MKTKIKWFREVLELEPGSKVFFPLARLEHEDGGSDEAVETLRRGLERNPEHLEAKLLLVEILSRLGRGPEARGEVESMAAMLGGYPAFWRVWAEQCAPKSKDSALALSFLASYFQGAAISWSEVIEKGLGVLFAASGSGAGPEPEPLDEPKEAEEEEEEEEPNLRTRTMADLLVEQGDYKAALDIYQELAARAPESEAKDLAALIESMQAKLGHAAGAADQAADEPISGEEGEDMGPSLPGPMPGKERMLSTLEALAARLEARAGQ